MMGKATHGLGFSRGRFPTRAVFVLVPLLALLGAGCSGDGPEVELSDVGANDAGGNDAGGIEKDAQADDDVDGDGDGDGDADADVDGDADVEIDAGADGDTEEDADVGDADAESDASVDADADADGGADADVDADADNDTDPMLARIEVTPDEASIVERRPVQLSAKGYGENDEEIDVDVTWSSSDETLATVDDEGLVTTLRPGTVTITATAFGTSDEATITITESTAARITFEADTINVPLDGEVQLHAIVEDAEGYELLGRAVSFESDDESVVTVTADGIATGIKEGEATIKAKLGALEASLDVRVVSGFAELVASARNTCALTAGGSVWCWGDDTYGQVGVGTNGATPYETPQRVDTVVSFEAVRLGRWFTCALSKEKEVWCWGANDDAVLGVAFASLWYATTPRLVPDRPYEKLSTFGYGACGLDAGGFAYCWGSGSIYYELGLGTRGRVVRHSLRRAAPRRLFHVRFGDDGAPLLLGSQWQRVPPRRWHHHASRAFRASARRRSRLRARSRRPRILLGKQCRSPTRPIHER